MKKLLASIVMLFALSACANSYNADVVRFYDQPLKPNATVKIRPASGFENGPEFRLYADMVIKKLSGLGFQPAKDSEPELIVEISYGVREQSYRHRFYSSLIGFYPGFYQFGYTPIYYPRYYSSFWFGSRMYDPFFYPYDPYFVPKNERVLNMSILKPDGTVMYEGRVTSVGYTGQLSKGMPYLVEALFKNFPGESGVVTNITIRQSDIAP